MHSLGSPARSAMQGLRLSARRSSKNDGTGAACFVLLCASTSVYCMLSAELVCTARFTLCINPDIAKPLPWRPGPRFGLSTDKCTRTLRFRRPFHCFCFQRSLSKNE